MIKLNVNICMKKSRHPAIVRLDLLLFVSYKRKLSNDEINQFSQEALDTFGHNKILGLYMLGKELREMRGKDL